MKTVYLSKQTCEMIQNEVREKGLNYRTLAEIADSTEATMWRICTGHTQRPSLKTVKKIENALGIHICDVVEDSNKSSEKINELEKENKLLKQLLRAEKMKGDGAKLYWVSAIVKNNTDVKPWLCAMTEGERNEDEAIEIISRLKEIHTVLSAWIDVFDENGNKKTIYHDCYVDVFGNLK